VSPVDDWNSLKEATELAVADLLEQLKSEAATEDLLDCYLYAKKLLAESMQAFLRASLVEGETFYSLRARLQTEINTRYAGVVPERYLRLPYGSRVHEELFMLLLQRQGTPVQAALLRVVTGDSVHTEQRVRELRELGLDIQTSKESGYDTYTLSSLDIDHSFIPKIVANLINKDSRLSSAQKQALLARLN
jgi:hypothetical protein